MSTPEIQATPPVEAPSAPVLQAQQSHVDAVLKALDDLIERVGQDIATGIQHEDRAVRVGASDLKNVLDSLQGARHVVAAVVPGGNSGPTVNVGPSA